MRILTSVLTLALLASAGLAQGQTTTPAPAAPSAAPASPAPRRCDEAGRQDVG